MCIISSVQKTKIIVLIYTELYKSIVKFNIEYVPFHMLTFGLEYFLTLWQMVTNYSNQAFIFSVEY